MGNLTMEMVLIALSGIVIVFLILLALSGMIVIMSRVVGAVTGQSKAAVPAATAPRAASAPAPITPAPVVLTGVDDLTAACIMAIVSDKMGVAPDQLVFKSIKAL